ncbi:MAG: sigma-70 family RNA polymerase sigma factor [Prevotella sp.]|nr:sigma-70 family RNA polymerase sigma factor [Prevotella sp.]
MYGDRELIRLLSDEATREKGFAALVEQYGEKVYWQVRRIVVSHDDANDVVQNAFIKAWMNIGSFEGKSKIFTWLSRIAINEALDFVHKRRARACISADEDVVVANRLIADEYFDGDLTQAQLQEAVSRLPDVQRTVFTLRYFEEMKYSDMSAVLGTSVGALKASYHHAVKKIEDFFNNID